MNREIKFRAWDKEQKKFIGSNYPDNWSNEKDEWWADEGMMMLTGIEDISKKERYVLQQYTGLKDKNGKEIYEGDIMSSEMGNGRITWVECSGKFVLEGDNFLINPWDGYEVIGNIFENHNLLTK